MANIIRWSPFSPRALVIACLMAIPVLGTVQAGVDVQVNLDLPGDVQNEVRLAIESGSGNFQNLVMAYNDRNGSASPNPLGISYSNDAGLTWNDTQLSVPLDPFGPPGSTLPAIFDPILASGPGLDFYAGYIAAGAGGPGSASGLFIERSTDGGMTWSGPTTISIDAPGGGPGYRFNDRPHMAADLAGFIHVTWIKDVGLGAPTSDIFYNYSVQPGPSFNFLPASVIVNDNPNGIDRGNAPYVASHPNGTTYVSWIDYNVTTSNELTGTLMLDSTSIPPMPGPAPVFGTDIQVRQVDPLPRFLSTNAGVFDDARAQSYPVIAVDANDPTAQTVFMAYAEEVTGTGDEGDIFFIKTTNGGTSWSAPIRINDDNTSNDQMHPEIVVKQNGTIDIAWYDKRNGPNDDAWDVYIARSTDGGNSFSANARITDTTFATPTAAGGSPPWLGEYLGLTTDGTNAYLGFTSSVNDSRGDVFFDVIANSQIPEPCTLFLAMVLVVVGTAPRRRRARSCRSR